VSEPRREVRSPVRWPSKKATSCETSDRKSCSRTLSTPRSPALAKSQARPPTASPCTMASTPMRIAASRTVEASREAMAPSTMMRTPCG